jgi:acetyl-CoA C-acetyltransferase
MENPMTQAFIVDAVRTPRGRGSDKGTLKDIKPAQLLAQALHGLQQRQSIDTDAICDAAIGCVTQTADQGSNIGKMAVMLAGWSDAVSAFTLNRYCASGLTAVQLAAGQALANDALAVGGGVEMMSRVPMGSDCGPLTHDSELQTATGLVSIGLAADAVATMEGFSRAQCDDYAALSQQRACTAREQGWFRSLLPVQDASGATLLTQDETPRAGTTSASLATLPPAFARLGEKSGIDKLLCAKYGLAAIDHVQHAGNSPAMADGASAVLVASAGALKRHGLHPRARILASADASVDRTLALTGSVAATQKALARAGLSVADIDLFEVNESFAALMLHYMRHLDVPIDKLNVNGGAIALGHAMGSTGSALIGTVLDELERRAARRAVIVICGAAGVAVAMVIERCEA